MSLIFDNITFEGKLILSGDNAGGSGGGGGGATTATYLVVGGEGGMSTNTRYGTGIYYAAGGTGGVSTGTLTLSAGKTYNINIGQGGAMNDYYYSYSFFSYSCWCNRTYENYGSGGAGVASNIATTSTYNAGTSTGSIEYNTPGIAGYLYGPGYQGITQLNPYYGATWFDRDSVPSFGVEAWVFPQEDRPMVFFSIGNPSSALQIWNFGMGDAYGNGASVHGTRKPYFGAWQGTNISSQLTSSCVWGADDLPIGQWTHLAGMYDSTSKKIKLYVNGKLAGQTADGKIALESFASYYQTNSGVVGTLGGSNIWGGYGLNALINDLRCTVGEIAYTSEFTPPTSRLTATQYTVLLGFQSKNINNLLAQTSFILTQNYTPVASNLDPSTNVAVYAGGGAPGNGNTYGGGGKSGYPQNSTPGVTFSPPWPYGGGVANVTSSITGTPVVYGGGTASGNINPSLAGYGVSNGYQPFNDPGWEYTHQTLGNDGKYYANSGLAILSIPTANYSGTTTGSPTVTTTGTNTILVYTQNGTYTA